ncbi:MAG: winged helix-turn-helix transcriptional regulator [Phycisphaerales bacterium]|jgi:ArsR family transcriptional regulator|nr:winged helix-turn-helix transcriptional regulator [Phycisphaerales bacterium]
MIRDFLDIATALSDMNRTRVLLALRHGELCVCQIVELLCLAPSTTSKHLSILKRAELVDARKQARWMYYALPANPTPIVQQAIAWTFNALEQSSQTKDDDKLLADILKQNPADLCRRQSGKVNCYSPVPENATKQKEMP